jgi:hypothetical protein
MAILAAVPAFLGGVIALKSGSWLIGGAAVVCGVLAMGLVQTFLVPLVRAQP